MYTRNDVEEKIVRILRDNASNMVSGLTIANITSLPCLAHSLQPIIKDGVLLQQSVVQLLSCARSLVSYYHHSNGLLVKRRIMEFRSGILRPIILSCD